MNFLFFLLFLLAIGFVGYSGNAIRHYSIKKNLQGMFVSVICVAVGLSGAYFSGRKFWEGISVPVSSASRVQPQPIPLTHALDKKEVWQVVSNFERVDGAPSLFVGQAHRRGEHRSINHLVFLDVGSCPDKVRLPRNGDKIPVLSLEVRVGGILNTVTKDPVSSMFFVQPECN